MDDINGNLIDGIKSWYAASEAYVSVCRQED